MGMTNSCLGQHSLPANPPADQPNLTGEHTSYYSSFLAHSPNFWLTQGLRWHSAEWKNVRVVEDDENTLQCCFSPGFLLSSDSPVHWPRVTQDSTLAIPLPHQVQGFMVQGVMLLPQERNTARQECSRESLRELDLPFLLSSDSCHGQIPIDHVWRVGERNDPPHGSSNSSQHGFWRLWHEQNRQQDHSLLLPLELSFPKPLSTLPVVKLCSDCPTWMRAYIPSAQDQAHLGKRA